jgi:hypothetical protein
VQQTAGKSSHDGTLPGPTAATKLGKISISQHLLGCADLCLVTPHRLVPTSQPAAVCCACTGTTRQPTSMEATALWVLRSPWAQAWPLHSSTKASPTWPLPCMVSHAGVAAGLLQVLAIRRHCAASSGVHVHVLQLSRFLVSCTHGGTWWYLACSVALALPGGRPWHSARHMVEIACVLSNIIGAHVCMHGW